ncbi:Lar family restriction alleviation protein [Xenorhabdus bovienii]|uniref:Lar family restriction alleviation protein n=1 Tax=Xenorhabdus bovienii TaxID=40576 RepID=UPI001EDE1EEA|nr:Lar family restriction alleviation protein [Xenorhabdus bovienii]MCG3462169.1 Lar family restriction alleviation protein [Xenorhabdus bovienii]
MTDKLKPCPECGGEDLGIVGFKNRYFVECHNIECLYFIITEKNMEMELAISAWNQRANDDDDTR